MARPGRAAAAHSPKKITQPVAAATNPVTEARVVRPNEASAVSSANWVAVWAGLVHSADR